jgi:hypothetical protein
MQNATNVEKTGLTILTAINTAKALTICCLVVFAIIFGIQDFRQVIYLCLHISYCLWWLLEQWFFPQRQQMFNEACGGWWVPLHIIVRWGFLCATGIPSVY